MKKDSYNPDDDPELAELAALEKEEELKKETGTADAGQDQGSVPADTSDDPELRMLAELEKLEELKKKIDAQRPTGQ